MTTPVMTDIEEIVWNYLTKRGIEFQFATSMRGGIFELGGAVVDFLLTELNLAWRVHGEYWHRGVEKEGSDIIQREWLEAEGWIVVDLWSEDILKRLNEAMRNALTGKEML